MLRPATILAVLLTALTARAEPARIVTAGAAVTEIVSGLGLAPQIVAVDASSKHLEETRDKPDIGYVRMLGAEGILSQKPDLVLVSSEAGPPSVLEQITSAGVDVVVIPNGYSLDNIDDKIRAIAAATGRVEEGEQLIARALGKAWGKTDGEGMKYLDPHGEAQRGLWMKFREDMNAIDWSSEEQDTMVKAAQHTFDAISALDDEIHLA